MSFFHRLIGAQLNAYQLGLRKAPLKSKAQLEPKKAEAWLLQPDQALLSTTILLNKFQFHLELVILKLPI